MPMDGERGVDKKKDDGNEMQWADQLVWEWWWRKVPSVLLYYHPCMIRSSSCPYSNLYFSTHSLMHCLVCCTEQCYPVWWDRGWVEKR